MLVVRGVAVLGWVCVRAETETGEGQNGKSRRGDTANEPTLTAKEAEPFSVVSDIHRHEQTGITSHRVMLTHHWKSSVMVQWAVEL